MACSPEFHELRELRHEEHQRVALCWRSIDQYTLIVHFGVPYKSDHWIGFGEYMIYYIL